MNSDSVLSKLAREGKLKRQKADLDYLNKIQRFRVKRNECLYDPRGLIGKNEAEAIHQTAKEFWGKVRTYLEKENPQLKLFREV